MALCPFLTAWRRMADLFRRTPEPAETDPSFRGMVTTTGVEELARRERLQRIHGSTPTWLDRPERDALRRDLRSSPFEDR